jgi:hypothetical protein
MKVPQYNKGYIWQVYIQHHIKGGKTANIPSEVKNKTRVSTLYSYSVVLEFLARAIRQEEEIKGIQIWKEVVKLSLLADDMILHLKLLNHKQLQQSTGYKINLQKLVYMNNE